ncbi:MAG: head maturation protease, ClpP-related [Lacipirellulaceae bacterium]
MDIHLYGAIGDYFDGLTSGWLRDELQRAGRDEPITLRINSPGGLIMETVAMIELLGRHRGPIDATIDGLAASCASYLAATIPKVSIAQGGMLMIHDPWALSVGTASDLRKEADVLDKMAANIGAAYAAKCGKTDIEVRAAMAEETWLTADEALAWGFVESVTDSQAKGCRVPAGMGYRKQPAASLLDQPTADGRHAAVARRSMQRRMEFERVAG